MLTPAFASEPLQGQMSDGGQLRMPGAFMSVRRTAGRAGVYNNDGSA
eukprot:CAMPEP_0119470170 /NCGR_PEP_ID=MMETSP1344-20130328/3191_1 /TAXON_ID=236787 /ORGANISM="Florenciella parvula, Strain CCMP2471" /LENGTH=46 /DNA_ID= /DNA_START= /DNA_END= /DNA_ORIENTATION=